MIEATESPSKIQIEITDEQDEDYEVEGTGDLRPPVKTDRNNIILLFFLYLLQGIPIGLSSSVPLILQNKSISYKDQMIFSLVGWPFCLKLLWAPIVDSFHYPRMGRRKSWLIPIQYLIGVTMLVLSTEISKDDLPGIYSLTAMFFTLNFLAATQDIVVDGWALTMLSKENVGYASTCNSVGQTTGYFISNVFFLALESADFCNTFLRRTPKENGIITLDSFLKIWAFVFIFSTTILWIFKKEARLVRQNNGNDVLGIAESYQMLLRILKLPAMKMGILLLLTCKIGFACTDGVTGLKLIESGVPKEHLAFLAIPLIPLQIILPLIISRYTAGPFPLNVMIKAYPYRLILGLILAGIVWWTSTFNKKFPAYYYSILLLVYCLYQITFFCTFVALMAFFARVSSSSMGGTYMTLLNTVSNLGSTLPTTAILWLIYLSTVKACPDNDPRCNIQDCYNGKKECKIVIDGYYIITVVCFLYGVLWYTYFGKRSFYRLQILHISAWKTN